MRVWLPESAVSAAPARRPIGSATAAAGPAGGGRVTAPMQGTIIEVSVAVGDAVAVGQPLCVLEAMKMENAVDAERAGTVTEVHVSPGDNVSAGDVLFVLE